MKKEKGVGEDFLKRVDDTILETRAFLNSVQNDPLARVLGGLSFCKKPKKIICKAKITK